MYNIIQDRQIFNYRQDKWLKNILPEVPSTCTNIQFWAMAQTGSKTPPENRGWGRTWTAGREPVGGTEDSERWVKEDDRDDAALTRQMGSFTPHDSRGNKIHVNAVNFTLTNGSSGNLGQRMSAHLLWSLIPLYATMATHQKLFQVEFTKDFLHLQRWLFANGSSINREVLRVLFIEGRILNNVCNNESVECSHRLSETMGSMDNALQLMNPLTFREKCILLNSICVRLIIQGGGRKIEPFGSPSLKISTSLTDSRHLMAWAKGSPLNHGTICFLISNSDGSLMFPVVQTLDLMTVERTTRFSGSDWTLHAGKITCFHLKGDGD